MGEESLVARVGDGFGDRGIEEFLGVVEFVASWVASGVVVAEVLMIVFDGADDVAFHDLHVVDVVEQFEVIAADLFDQLNPPARRVTHVIRVIDFAVEQFHVQDHASLFGDGYDFFESRYAVLHPRLSD